MLAQTPGAWAALCPVTGTQKELTETTAFEKYVRLELRLAKRWFVLEGRRWDLENTRKAAFFGDLSSNSPLKWKMQRGVALSTGELAVCTLKRAPFGASIKFQALPWIALLEFRKSCT